LDLAGGRVNLKMVIAMNLLLEYLADLFVQAGCPDDGAWSQR